MKLSASLGLPKSKTEGAESQELHAKCAVLEVFFEEWEFWIHQNWRLLLQRVTGLMEVGQLLCISGGGLLNQTKATEWAVWAYMPETAPQVKKVVVMNLDQTALSAEKSTSREKPHQLWACACYHP